MTDPAEPARLCHTYPPARVGRAREYAILCEHLARALRGQGGLVLVSGEAGIGKTALAEALGQAATAHGALVLTGRCYDLTDTPPYGLWLDLFNPQPAVADLPSPPSGLLHSGAAASSTTQAVLFAQVRDCLVQAAGQHPLVLLLDDLHWADPTSLDLLRVIARHVAALPLLVIATYRAEEVLPSQPLYALLPALVREARAVRLDLRPLDDNAVRVLIGARYRLPPADEARLVAYLHAQAEGNPFYLEEVLRALEEEGVVQATAVGWTVGDLTQVRVPTLLQQIITGRVRRLGADVAERLSIAATIGQEVPLTVWAAVAGTDETALLDTVERAAEAQLLAAADDGQHVRFRHPLVRTALYQSILPPRRRRWHRQAGEALVAAAVPDPDAVAYHFRQAGDARAVAWLVRAAERAQRAEAWLTAAERVAAALALLDADGTTAERGWLLFRLALLRRYVDQPGGIATLEQAERLAAAAQDQLLAAQSAFTRGLFRCWVGEVRRGVAEMEAGLTALDAVPSPASLHPWASSALTLAPGGTDPRGPLVLWLALTGRYAEARALAERTTPAAGVSPGVTPDPLDAAAANATRGLAYTDAALGRPDAARAALARARAAYHALDQPVMAGETAVNELDWVVVPYQADRLAERQCLATEAAAAWTRAQGVQGDWSPQLARLPLLVLEGRWDEARRLAMHVRDGATVNTLTRTLARRILGALAREQGDHHLAWALVREGLPDGPAAAPGGSVFLAALATQRLAAALALDAGDLATARTWLEAHDRWLAWSGTMLGQAEGHLGWAAYYEASGDLATAHQQAKQALACAGDPRQPLTLLATHRLLGCLATAAGSLSEAARYLETALALAETCAVAYEQAVTLLALAELRHAAGQQAEAHALLDEVRATGAPLGAARALAQADALAARLAGAVARPGRYPAGLTAREVEVLRLIAAGQSNREIAAALSISVRTVERHINNIYRKIDARGKADATAFAFRHALL